jgi:excisionase family DNA binding protein
MADDLVSVPEAAAMLGVNRIRVFERIREGSLPAEKVGNRWAIQTSDVRRIMHHAAAGRPLSPKSSWDLLAVAGDCKAAELSRSARSRANARLRELLDQASSAVLDDVVVALGSALRNRAVRSLYIASPRDVPDVRNDPRVHLSGVSLPESNMAAGEVAEGYVSSDDLKTLVDDYLLSPAQRTNANVILHVVEARIDHPAIAALDDLARSPLALAADLAEYDGVREKAEAVRLMGEMQDSVESLSAGAVRD